MRDEHRTTQCLSTIEKGPLCRRVCSALSAGNPRRTLARITAVTTATTAPPPGDQHIPEFEQRKDNHQPGNKPKPQILKQRPPLDVERERPPSSAVRITQPHTVTQSCVQSQAGFLAIPIPFTSKTWDGPPKSVDTHSRLSVPLRSPANSPIHRAVRGGMMCLQERRDTQDARCNPNQRRQHSQQQRRNH